MDHLILIHKFLSGVATEKERQQLMAWAERDPAHKEELEEIIAIWKAAENDGSDSMVSHEELEEEWQKLEINLVTVARQERTDGLRTFFVRYRVAAVIVI